MLSPRNLALVVGGLVNVQFMLAHVITPLLAKMPPASGHGQSATRARLAIAAKAAPDACIFALIAFVSFAYGDELTQSRMGRALTTGLSIFFVFYSLKYSFDKGTALNSRLVIFTFSIVGAIAYAYASSE